MPGPKRSSPPLLPLFANMCGRRVLIVGGGKVALRKAQTFSCAGAAVTVIAPDVLPALRDIPGTNIVVRTISRKDLRQKWFLVVIATDRPQLNARVARVARTRGLLVNRTDAEEQSDLTTGALFQTHRCSIGVSCRGAPLVAMLIRDFIRLHLPPEHITLARLLRSLRTRVKRSLPTPVARAGFWRQFTTAEFLERVRREDFKQLRNEILKQLEERSKQTED